LIEVGTGKRKPEEMAAILEAGDRSIAGFTAPPEGLFLEKVEYGDLI
ncbi:MAG: tRNA pseudouridine(38-40) synthase TruA, partial [Enterocloster sp.]|nr:tRNA pseudouridine(38-40) synthase TruA [Enterocloster sp.]